MSFEIHLGWPDGTRAPDAEIADVCMVARRQLLTQLFVAHENVVRDQFRTSAVKLAFWFADNWWRLRWERIGDLKYPSIDWRLRHEMRSGGGSSIWPPLMIYGGGPRVIISPILGGHAEVAGLRYLLDRPISVSGDAFEAGVDAMFDNVLGACANHADAHALRTLLQQLRHERDDDALASWRRLEACLGYDPDQAPDRLIDAMIGLEDEVGADTVEEAAVAVQGEDAPGTLKAAIEATCASDLVVDLAAVRAVADAGQTIAPVAPWRAAEDAAHQFRRRLALPDVIDWRILGDILATRREHLKTATATARQLPYATRGGERCGSGKLALQCTAQVDRKFELARMIGDEVWTGGRGLGVVTRTETDRQKFQRAFAQTLLCPMHDLGKVVDLDAPTPEQMRSAARRFGVREAAVRTILVNRGFLRRETLEEQLEIA